jgi:hypothetical protein
MFEEEDDAAFHSLVKQMLADVFDRMHMCEDEIETTKLKNPLPFNHKGCDELFANFVREALGALLTRREEFTIQVKNLSQWERVWCHKDGFNCAWNSYTKTLTLCFTWVDALGDIWSLRLVSNSRAKGGNHLNKTYKLPEILTRMRRLMGKLNGEFEKLMLLQQNVGGHRYPNGLTYKTWENIILEDCSPWLEVDIGNGIMQKQMGFTAGCVRKLFLAGPCTIVYLLNNRLGVEEKAVELAIHAYNPGYSHFYNIGKTKFARLVAADSPSHAMYQIALEKFDGVPFGDNQSGRISLSGVNYPAVFLDADGKPNSVMKVMVAGVMKVLRWIDANKDIDDQFHHAGIQKVVQELIDEWKDMAKKQKESGPDATKYLEGLNRLDFAEFRMMVALQICCLMKVVVKGHANLNNLVYPISNLGAAKQMSHLDSSERSEMLRTIIREMEVTHYGTNAGEGSLCENAENRVGTIFDYAFYGSMMFCITEDGKNMLKFFGSDSWVEF